MMKQYITDGFKRLGGFYRWFISGIWFVQIVRQMVITGGNVAESAFLLATLWVIVNAVAHTLVSWVLSAHDIELVNNLSTIAFGALPELILISVICICYNHWSAGIKQKNKASYIWAILYTAPALFFAVITISCITTFVSTKGTEYISMDPIWLVIRCLSGWVYAIVNMLFQRLGEPHYASRFAEKDSEIDQLKATIDQLKADHSTEKEKLKADYSIEIEKLTGILKTQNEQVNLLSERASSLNRDVLENYPIIVKDWIEKGRKTVSIEEIEMATGCSKQKISGGLRSGKLVKDNRNKELIRVSSVVEWLRAMSAEKATNSSQQSTAKQQPKERTTDELKPVNGHKNTRPLGELVELEI